MFWKAQKKRALYRFLSYFGNERKNQALQSFQTEREYNKVNSTVRTSSGASRENKAKTLGLR